jgi:hypothetical protein
MKVQAPKSIGLVALWVLAFSPYIQAHTWVEQLKVVAPNGTFVGEAGFARGNVLRSAANFDDDKNVNLIPPNGRSTGNAILTTDLMCKSTQTKGNQTPGSPALKASLGDMIALRYQENGHVTLPENQPGKPENRGTVFIYGTTKPSDSDTFLSIHKVWTADGKGGDGRGVLLATRNYDDGQCYQVNGGSISQQRQKQFSKKFDNLMGDNLWCQSDVKLPTSIDGTSYTLYWVWDWPTAPGTPGAPNGLNETYTTCMDINLVAASGSSKAVDDANFVKGQDLNHAAIESELSTPFIVPVTAAASGPQPTAQGSATTSHTPAVHTSSATVKNSLSTGPAATDRGNRPIVTVTQSIHDTVTIYKTYFPLSVESSSAPASGSTLSKSSMKIEPFLAATGTVAHASSTPTTLTTKIVSEDSAGHLVAGTVPGTTVKGYMVTKTVVVSVTPTARRNRIRGRSVSRQ